MSEAAITEVGAIVYHIDEVKRFLVAVKSETLPAWRSSFAGDIYYGFAKTAHQFNSALLVKQGPTTQRLTKDDLIRLMADELTGHLWRTALTATRMVDNTMRTRGRPKMTGPKCDHRTTILLQSGEQSSLRNRAASDGVSVSTFVRRLILKELAKGK